MHTTIETTNLYSGKNIQLDEEKLKVGLISAHESLKLFYGLNRKGLWGLTDNSPLTHFQKTHPNLGKISIPYENSSLRITHP